MHRLLTTKYSRSHGTSSHDPSKQHHNHKRLASFPNNSANNEHPSKRRQKIAWTVDIRILCIDIAIDSKRQCSCATRKQDHEG